MDSAELSIVDKGTVVPGDLSCSGDSGGLVNQLL